LERELPHDLEASLHGWVVLCVRGSELTYYQILEIKAANIK
jgi:hypothetical protein